MTIHYKNSLSNQFNSVLMIMKMMITCASLAGISTWRTWVITCAQPNVDTVLCVSRTSGWLERTFWPRAALEASTCKDHPLGSCQAHLCWWLRHTGWYLKVEVSGNNPPPEVRELPSPTHWMLSSHWRTQRRVRGFKPPPTESSEFFSNYVFAKYTVQAPLLCSLNPKFSTGKRYKLYTNFASSSGRLRPPDLLPPSREAPLS